MTKKRFRKLLMATRSCSRNDAENMRKVVLEIFRFCPGTGAFSYFAVFMGFLGYCDSDLIDSQYPEGVRVRIEYDDLGMRGSLVTRTPGYYTAEMELRLVRVFADFTDYFKDKNGNTTRG